MLVAAFIFAIAAVLVKLTGGRVPVLEITLIRSAISLVVSAGEVPGVSSNWCPCCLQSRSCTVGAAFCTARLGSLLGGMQSCTALVAPSPC